MAEYYKPPFTINEEITNLVIEIGELVGKISVSENLKVNPKLRRKNRIRTIHSSLAIEQNTLSISQVTDVINGKRVLAPPQDILEVKNAYEAYEMLKELNPYSVEDLLKAHKMMTAGLIPESGIFKPENNGVYAGDILIHPGSPAKYTPELMGELFEWLKETKLHPLIKASIFHYEFEFIHPFSDGNGRMGRLWHTLILREWKDFFAWLPVETIIYDNQDAYYAALNYSNNVGDSAAFVEFMLTAILKALQELSEVSRDKKAEVLDIIRKNPAVTAKAIAEEVNLSQRQVERILADMKSTGLILRDGARKNGLWKIYGVEDKIGN